MIYLSGLNQYHRSLHMMHASQLEVSIYEIFYTFFNTNYMNAYQYTTESLSEQSNQVKDIFIQTLLMDGVITKELYEEMQKYGVIVHERGFFGQLLDKILFKDLKINQAKITVAKIL